MAVKKKKKSKAKGISSLGKLGGGGQGSTFTSGRGGGSGSGSFASGLRDAATSMGIPFATADAIHTMASMGDMSQADALSLIGMLSNQQAAGDMQEAALQANATEGAGNRAVEMYLGGQNTRAQSDIVRQQIAQRKEEGSDRRAELTAATQAQAQAARAQAQDTANMIRLMGYDLNREKYETQPDREAARAEQRRLADVEKYSLKPKAPQQARDIRAGFKQAYSSAYPGMSLDKAQPSTYNEPASRYDLWARQNNKQQVSPEEFKEWLEQTYPQEKYGTSIPFPHYAPKKTSLLEPEEPDLYSQLAQAYGEPYPGYGFEDYYNQVG